MCVYPCVPVCEGERVCDYFAFLTFSVAILFSSLCRDEVRDVGERVGAYVSRKHYLHATQLLVTSLNRLQTDLKKVNALKDVNTDLHSRKEVSLGKL